MSTFLLFALKKKLSPTSRGCLVSFLSMACATSTLRPFWFSYVVVVPANSPFPPIDAVAFVEVDDERELTVEFGGRPVRMDAAQWRLVPLHLWNVTEMCLRVVADHGFPVRLRCFANKAAPLRDVFGDRQEVVLPDFSNIILFRGQLAAPRYDGPVDAVKARMVQLYAHEIEATRKAHARIATAVDTHWTPETHRLFPPSVHRFVSAIYAWQRSEAPRHFSKDLVRYVLEYIPFTQHVVFDELLRSTGLGRVS